MLAARPLRTAANHLDFGEVQVLRWRGKLGRRLGHGQGQVDRYRVLAVFIKDHEGAGYLDELRDRELVKLQA